MSVRKKIYKYQALSTSAPTPPRRKLKSISYLRLGKKVEKRKILVDKERMSMMILMLLQKSKNKMIQFNNKSTIFQ